ncbi:hypothetical protein [Flexithrix dorotheae]|uniref:hypothetical protein n=1 Tax=Flexithrix dorotheae TaxID=70993 RepID=UPI0012FC80B9|nr:hypothetical protein [Flexithrix dorotheae]
MKNKSTYKYGIISGTLILIMGILGLNGIGNEYLIPFEVYVAGGIGILGFNIWKLLNSSSTPQDENP